MSSRDRSGKSSGRFAMYFVSRGWLHLVLLTFAALFLFPFVWMLTTSFRTDEELSEPGWLPEIPTFRAASPYVRRTMEARRPADATEAQWAAALPAIEDAARRAARAELDR